jgi:hypothetical protein
VPLTRASGLLGLIVLASPATALAGPPTKQECVSANESAQYLRQADKLREAREKLLLCVAEECPGPIREDCAQRLDEVARATPSIVFEFKDDRGNDVAGVQMTMDGQSLATSAPGAAFDLDPGEHTFTFEAASRPRFEKTFVVVEGVKRRREVIRLASKKTPEHTSPASAPAKDEEEPAGRSRRTLLTWAAFGVGGAGVGVGIVAGLVADGKHSTLQSECNNNTNTCAPQSAGDLDAFHTSRTISTIGYVVGALGLAGGAVLWFTAPKAPTSTARMWLGPASAGIAGTF